MRWGFREGRCAAKEGCRRRPLPLRALWARSEDRRIPARSELGTRKARQSEQARQRTPRFPTCLASCLEFLSDPQRSWPPKSVSVRNQMKQQRQTSARTNVPDGAKHAELLGGLRSFGARARRINLAHNTHFCSWSFCSSWQKSRGVGTSRDLPAPYARFFRALGNRIRSYRTERKLTQEDMISLGFSVRHWQMMEAGRPITVFTLLRVCEAFDVTPEHLFSGLSSHLRKRKR